MASLPSAHPSLSLHLTDPALTPLISSSSTSPVTRPSRSSSPRFRALTEITTASLSAYTSASRLGLGQPLRLMIETKKGAPVILHSFLNPQPSNNYNNDEKLDAATTTRVLDQTREALRPLSSSTIKEPTSAHAPDTTIVSEATHVVESPVKVTVSEAMASSQILPNGSLGIDKGKSTKEEQSPTITQLIDEKEEDPQLPPLLIATTVAPTHDQEARRAARKLDRLGIEFQRRWAKDQAQSQQQNEENDGVDEAKDRDGERAADG